MDRTGGCAKIREASYVAAEGLLGAVLPRAERRADEQDTLVVLDGGGPAAERTEAIARAVEVTGAAAARFARAISAKRCRCSR